MFSVLILRVTFFPSSITGSKAFTTSGQFKVSPGVNNIHVLAVGGGAGGGSGSAGGGGSGYVKEGYVAVNVGDVITVTVGRGGSGSTFKINMDAQDAYPGERSSFDSLVVADGENKMNPMGRTGGDGGSGGGGDGVQSKSGDGGTGGSDGANGSAKGDKGQGDYSSLLSSFKLAKFTAGSCGKGGVNCGGGGGGVLMNGHGPAAIGLDKCAFGGKGFGASGAGGFDENDSSTSPSTYIHNEGGSGADGLVYVEW